jgi:hypothetical protein
MVEQKTTEVHKSSVHTTQHNFSRPVSTFTRKQPYQKKKNRISYIDTYYLDRDIDTKFPGGKPQ